MCQQDHKSKHNTGSGITWQYLVISGNQGDVDCAYVNYYKLMKSQKGKISGRELKDSSLRNTDIEVLKILLSHT